MEIGPNFGLKEHYYLKAGGIFFPIGSDYYCNRNSFIWKEYPATCEIGMNFWPEILPHCLIWKIWFIQNVLDDIFSTPFGLFLYGSVV